VTVDVGVMPPPNDAPLPTGVQVKRKADGTLVASKPLVDLLVDARSKYDWPAGTGTAASQKRILALEANAACLTGALDAEGAHSIVSMISRWAGNNKKAQTNIDFASPQTRAGMMTAIGRILGPSTLKNGLDGLCALPGLRLVTATKVYRFCCPKTGAAVDRHASYFFNSLDIVDPEGIRCKGTMFKREWAKGKHKTSRLAIYNPSHHVANRDQFVDRYLPLLAQIASSLNCMGANFRCAATGREKSWRPADVEMAAYHWWARFGPKR